MRLDEGQAIMVAENIWWVGFADYEAGFSNNPYLLVDGEEGVLIDPGPGHPVFRDLILQKIEQVIEPEKIRYIIVGHQDPDLCALIPFIENVLHPDVVIIAHPRTSLFIPYYGVRKNILPVGDGDQLELLSGRRLGFHHTPYLHFAGNMVVFDEKTGSLFSSDIFALFSREWKLYADDSYLDPARSFIEHYVGDKKAVRYAYKKLRNLPIKRILPQHGGIIEEAYLPKFLKMLEDVEPGRLLEELETKPTKDQSKILIQAGEKWLSTWLKKDVRASSFDELLDRALKAGPSAISLLLDSITEEARQLGVANPLTFERLHRSGDMFTLQSTRAMELIRNRFLSRQYGLTDRQKADGIITQGLESFKVQVVVMFADIRGFTKWSSERSPGEVVDLLNREHGVIAKIINSGGGRVNKILGDGVLAYFPESKMDQAISVAEKMHKEIDKNGYLPTGIGLAYGDVIMGDIGEEARLDYTLIGPVVNLASRMCDIAKKGEIALTKEFYDLLSDIPRKRIQSNPKRETIGLRLKPTDPETEAVKYAVIDYA
jgi:class 3 adenylate cyclase